MRIKLFSLVSTLGFAAGLYGQEVVSIKAGLVHYVEGSVSVDGKPLEGGSANSAYAKPQEVKLNSLLETELGRVEILMSPGVFLRVGEHSAFRMLANKPEDTRIELLQGSMVLEVDELYKENLITVRYKDSTVTARKDGLYRFDANPGELRVYDGEADVVVHDQTAHAKKGMLVSLEGNERARKFDTDTGDALLRWSQRRAGYIAVANVSAAKTLRDSGISWMRSGWLFNPYFGLYTFIPMRGTINSPFGYQIYSPQQVIAVYQPRQPRPTVSGFGSQPPIPGGPRYDPSLGYSTSDTRTYTSSVPMTSAPSNTATAPPAAAATDSRSAPTAAPRSGGGATTSH